METKMFGLQKGVNDGSDWKELNQVSVASSPADLRRIAAFLTQCANDIDQHGSRFGHAHLRDEPDLRPWNGEAVDVIVTCASAPSGQ